MPTTHTVTKAACGQSGCHASPVLPRTVLFSKHVALQLFVIVFMNKKALSSPPAGLCFQQPHRRRLSMRTALALALALVALASGVHGDAHTQCQDGTVAAAGWNIGKRERLCCTIVRAGSCHVGPRFFAMSACRALAQSSNPF